MELEKFPRRTIPKCYTHNVPDNVDRRCQRVQMCFNVRRKFGRKFEMFHVIMQRFYLVTIQFWHQRLAILCCKLPRQSYKFAAPSMTSQTKRRHHDVIPHAVVDNFTKILKSHDKSHQITTYSRWHANFLRLFDDIRCKQCWQKFLGKSSRNFLHN